MPREYPRYVIFPAAEAVKVIERVAMFADERSHAIRLTFAGEQFVVHSSIGETGEAWGGITVAEHNAAEGEVGLNAEYVLDFLRQTEGNVAFCWKDGKSSTEFQTKDGWRYVVMPMRT